MTDPLDNADLWPRFYFALHRAQLECIAWLQKRGEWQGHWQWERTDAERKDEHA